MGEGVRLCECALGSGWESGHCVLYLYRPNFISLLHAKVLKT